MTGVLVAYASKYGPDLAPVATAIFGGVLDPAFPYNRMTAGGHRDWDETRHFAASLPVRVSITA